MNDASPEGTGLLVRRERRAQGDVLHLRLCGRKALNLVGRDVMERAAATLAAAAGPDVRCAILSGMDGRAFIGGADLREIGSLTPQTAGPFIRSIHAFCAAIRAFPAPVIGRLEGYCLGAGLEIAAACDFRYAASTAQLGMPEVRIGVASVIEAVLLPQLIGWGHTRELLLRGHIIDAAEALRIRLVEHVCAPAELETAIEAAVADVLASAPRAVRDQKRLIAEWERLALTDAIEAGVATFVAAYDGTEPPEYTSRFFAGRDGH
ncbi:MAG: enoyl-CoA hydratase/isomerase family protein [Gammaproteobacteria bacterium]|nr:enoyl-CoA hydratase/isomerase family protein [Gammaproteobacteria bacterium]MBI5616150.1 enoyl-CoA hydratase/isomerase family protein [Gammaproteobacteria bacterium]